MIDPLVIRVAKQMIKDNEGFREKMYLDTTGHYTIGYGHNLQFMPITKTTADVMLQEDLSWFVENLPKHLAFFESLDDARKSVLLDMAYNLGLIGLLRFKKFLGYMAQKDYDKAADEMLNSVWARQVGQRAYNNARIIRTGVWVEKIKD